jgi:restriction system protein
MFRLAGRALSTLLLIAAAALVLLWQWAVEHPALAALTFGAALWYCVVAWRMEQVKRLERLTDAHVPDMSPFEYEQFAARLLKQAGWSVQHVGRQGDQGCDVIAELRGFKAVVQVKLHRKACGNAAVQQICGARKHYGAQVMAVVAPAGFTSSAKALAASNGVHLLHHAELEQLAAKARIPMRR